MQSHARLHTALVAAGIAAAMAVAGCGQSAKDVCRQHASAETLANLETAFNGESNAHARYVAFAQKADQEGYAQVASLFRAAARSEEVHARNHARVIRSFGAEPKADVKPAEVKSTAENLRAAIDGETYERDTMYPQFLTRAREENNDSALETFEFALNAEASHADLYTEALANLDTAKGPAQTFYVCRVCGYTTKTLPAERCPSCFNRIDKFEKVA